MNLTVMSPVPLCGVYLRGIVFC